ncbi:energy-coupling factor ABC transporter permease [Methanocalculus taiwanensis]|uniref:Putative cobalt transport protein CbiM n=1 Tax=Methanocalculus taiwanensis TaxID=106207 RepID=A0ABD4TMR8_9EURY|nr:energy-coupling factor ABC transporter permease [Methanocalculus taiwanensis]MCQ1539140.1 energy-coupling factor ABC transporter permease [Methanocalculus taiwanensis]
MHIMEGFLPSPWWQIWFILSAPFVIMGFYALRRMVHENREALPLLAVAGAFVFVLSSLKLPSVTGSCSHPTGTGLGSVLFGPFITSVLALIVLVYQALFLAHGGFSTLGANLFSMGIAGPVVAYAIFVAGKKAGINEIVTIFFAAAFANIITYVVTSLQLALAFPAEVGGIMASFVAFGAIFAITQIPLAIIEGLVIALVFKYIVQLKPEILIKIGVITQERAERLREGWA